MSCTKTGCHVWIEPYNEWAYGDAFEVGPYKTRDQSTIDMLNRMVNREPHLNTFVTNIAYFKIVHHSFVPINGLAVKHYTIHDYEEFIGGGSIEAGASYWPPAIMITNNFTNHGSQGIPI